MIIYIYVYILVYLPSYIQIYMNTYAHKCMSIYTCIYIHTQVYICGWKYTYMIVSAYSDVAVYCSVAYIYMYTNMYAHKAMCCSIGVTPACVTCRQLQHELNTPGVVTSAIACDASHVSCGLQDGWSALIYASYNGHSAVADKLISAGAKLDLQNKVRESGVPCGLCCRLICACLCLLVRMRVCAHV